MALASAMVFSPRSMTEEDEEEELEEGLELEELEEAPLEEDWLLELDPLPLLEEADELCSLEEVTSLEEEDWAEDSLEDELCSEEEADDSLLDAPLEASEEERLEEAAGSPPQEARANPNKANRRVFFFIAPNDTPNGLYPKKRGAKPSLKRKRSLRFAS